MREGMARATAREGVAARDDTGTGRAPPGGPPLQLSLVTVTRARPVTLLRSDYGYVIGSVEGKTLRCLCGAPSCRGYLF